MQRSLRQAKQGGAQRRYLSTTAGAQPQFQNAPLSKISSTNPFAVSSVREGRETAKRAPRESRKLQQGVWMQSVKDIPETRQVITTGPSELAQVAYEYGQAEKLNGDLWTAIAKRALVVRRELSGTAIVTLLHSFVLARWRNERLFSCLLEELEEKAHELSPSHLCVCLHAVSQFRIRNRKFQNLILRELQRESRKKELSSAPGIVAAFLRFLSRVGLEHSDALGSLQGLLSGRVEGAALADLATAATALASFPSHADKWVGGMRGEEKGKGEAEDEHTLQSLCIRLSERGEDALREWRHAASLPSPQDLDAVCDLMVADAELQTLHAPLYGAFTRAFPDRDSLQKPELRMSPETLVKIIYAFGKVGVPAPSQLAAATELVLPGVSSLTQLSLVQLLEGCAGAGFHNDVLFTEIADWSCQKAVTFSLKNMIRMLQACERLELFQQNILESFALNVSRKMDRVESDQAAELGRLFRVLGSSREEVMEELRLRRAALEAAEERRQREEEESVAASELEAEQYRFAVGEGGQPWVCGEELSFPSEGVSDPLDVSVSVHGGNLGLKRQDREDGVEGEFEWGGQRRRRRALVEGAEVLRSRGLEMNGVGEDGEDEEDEMGNRGKQKGGRGEGRLKEKRDRGRGREGGEREAKEGSESSPSDSSFVPPEDGGFVATPSTSRLINFGHAKDSKGTVREWWEVGESAEDGVRSRKAELASLRKEQEEERRAEASSPKEKRKKAHMDLLTRLQRATGDVDFRQLVTKAGTRRAGIGEIPRRTDMLLSSELDGEAPDPCEGILNDRLPAKYRRLPRDVRAAQKRQKRWQKQGKLNRQARWKAIKQGW
uniref:Uncharacterized protein n=1 Tax=Chromera velia CCMP2878 TaxID=1169474 RepID=A0A0G4HHY5_9ALVE|eukprot:Cvel_6927.t1-p1 / transcript=Cvel_6927.t1 / gene=Cvel_6927 / organism=Chromera_velia_CCMP2878 / gene_product=hypothetical protein / transcript_product=hypothetical protein / location=Cvel_scaffold350:72125-75374(-) / protein_length=836 / sequence_SO=supercontig / SO=protein_coding / is_pseudo=false